ncbi:glycosyltransferase family 1 protein [Archangium minus]|uniref:Glycosyltransferase family 1 protein n=1 Tax=Archangium minus TaxID=83450 RepID=A0ABY9X7Y1_9BACT|nr:glycosyltransferase family 1 protein [Archangium minus]
MSCVRAVTEQPRHDEAVVRERLGSASGPMRIAYFSEALLPLVDGVTLTLARLFETLEARQVDFRVFSAFSPPEDLRWAWRARRVGSLPFPLYRDYRMGLPPGGDVARELDAFRPQLIHVSTPSPMSLWAQRYARSRGIPVVSSFHTHFVAYLRYYGFGALEDTAWAFMRWFYSQCARVYVPTRRIMGELEAQGLRRCELWSRGVDAVRFSPAHRDEELRRSVGASDAVPLLLLVSRLVREKDLDELVGLSRRLRARGHAFRLVLVGDGPMRAELQSLLPEAWFVGHQTGEALARWYASADLFVFPSTTETFGNVVLESLASGVPAVVVDAGGPPELVREGHCGAVARPRDVEDLTHQVEALLRPEARRPLSQRARAYALRRDTQAVNGALVDSYAQVIAGRALPHLRVASGTV